MTGKSGSSKQVSKDSSSSDSLADVLSNLPLLLSSIALPEDYHVSFIKFEALDASQGHNDVELARRELVGKNASRTILDSGLPFVELTKDQANFWVFCVEKSEEATGWILDIGSKYRLKVIQTDRFQYKDLYPCSLACSSKRTPCADCLSPPQPQQVPTPPPLYRERSPLEVHSTSRSTSPFPPPLDAQKTPRHSACALPRISLRNPIKFFLSALRDRIVDDFCREASTREEDGRTARGFRGGLLIGASNDQSDWQDEWDDLQRCRPLVHCTVSPALYRSDIVISYRLSSTHLLPLVSSLPLPQGSPLYLLPFATPAYFVNTYTGSTDTLTKQFGPYLDGLGVGRWSSNLQVSPRTNVADFIIVWVKIQTPTDDDVDDSGFLAIWPSRLCVNVLPVRSRNGEKEYAYHRELQHPLPELPPALQPSPVPAAATVPPKSSNAFQPSITPSAVEASFRSSSPRPKRSTQSTRGFKHSFFHSRSSMASQYIHVMRRRHVLTRYRSLREIRDVALDVGKFVDSVAKEREKERERIRRERDAAQHTIKHPSEGGPLVDSGTPNDSQRQTPMDIPVEIPATLADANVTVATSAHPAYPSPPDETASIQPGPAPKVEDTVTFQDMIGNEAPKTANNVATASAPALNYTSFEGLDDSWMSNNEFMMDLGMDFGLDVGMGSSTGAQQMISNDPMKIDIDNFQLTDDDFKFFDDPLPSVFPASAGLDDGNILSAFEAAAGMITPAASNVQGELSVASLDSPWTYTKGPGAFASPVASAYSHRNQFDTPAPDLIPSSPSKSLATYSGPATPNVAFSVESFWSTQSSGLEQFNPLHFASKHSSLDAKYASGKFLLPSPSTDSSSGRSDCYFIDQSDFRTSYSVATDPRVGIIRRLLGSKSDGRHHSVSSSVLSASGSGDWTDIDPDDALSCDDGTESGDDSEDGDIFGETDELTSLQSRPSTPLPAYLPSGPTLLATKFNYDRLLPFAQTLPLPMPSFDEDDMDIDVHVVPTPVSPSAVSKTEDDELKRYQTLVQLITDELLDNPVWASAWRASLVEKSNHRNIAEAENVAWLDDVDFTTICCRAMTSMKTPTTAEQLSLIASPDEVLEGCGILQALEPSNIVVAKSDSLVAISTPATRFWDILGLGPRSGKKNATAFVVHNDQHDITDDAFSWLTETSRLYSARGYGEHRLGQSDYPACKQDGILVIQFENFRKQISNFLQLPEQSAKSAEPTIFYVITSPSMLSTLSPALRQILTGIKHILSNNPGFQIYFHLIPDLICKPSDTHYSKEMQEELVQSVYNRIQRPVYRMLSRQFNSESKGLCKWFKAPAFSLSPPSIRSISLSFQSSEHTSSSSDRHTILHVGYCTTENGRWLIAMCSDQRQEMQDMNIWRLDKGQAIMSKLWDFALKFAAKANIEWRMVFTKLGSISEHELDAWNKQAIDHLQTEAAGLHASLVSFVDEIWMVDANETEGIRHKIKRSADLMSRGGILAFQDSTFLLSHIRCPMSSLPGLAAFELNHIPRTDKESLNDRDEPLRPLHSSVLISYDDKTFDEHLRIHARYIHLISSGSSARSTLLKNDQENLADICQSYCDLTALQRAKWTERDPSPLPSPLATVSLMRSILDLSA